MRYNLMEDTNLLKLLMKIAAIAIIAFEFISITWSQSCLGKPCLCYPGIFTDFQYLDFLVTPELRAEQR